MVIVNLCAWTVQLFVYLSIVRSMSMGYLLVKHTSDVSPVMKPEHDSCIQRLISIRTLNPFTLLKKNANTLIYLLIDYDTTDIYGYVYVHVLWRTVIWQFGYVKVKIEVFKHTLRHIHFRCSLSNHLLLCFMGNVYQFHIGQWCITTEIYWFLDTKKGFDYGNDTSFSSNLVVMASFQPESHLSVFAPELFSCLCLFWFPALCQWDIY